MEILRKNNLPAAVLSLFLMIAAFFSIVFCEKEIRTLEDRFRSPDRMWEIISNERIAERLPLGLTRYDIKVSLMRPPLEDFGGENIEMQFCDKYSLILFFNSKRSGVYCNVGQSSEKYVSTVKYPQVFMPGETAYERLKGLNLRLKCDLIKKTAIIYIDGKFMEKIYLGPEPVNCSIGLNIRGTRLIKPNKLEISDHKGRLLFNANFFPLFLCKFISQVLLSLGALIFLASACSERLFFRRTLLFVILLFFLEAFLRIAYNREPDFDISQLKHRWQFEMTTNFYGAFNDPKEITINSYHGNDAPSTYPIANPEHAMRIICIGASPVQGMFLPADQAFLAVLERRINPRDEKKSRVIPMIITSRYSNGPEANVFLKEVLSRLNPDLLLFYGDLAPTEGNSYEYNFKKDFVLYNRAKNIMGKNSSWVKNDRLLYAALEFKDPVKEVVYLYCFLCKSYLFMAVENIRKRVLNKWRSTHGWHSAERESLAEKPESFFEDTLRLCREKKIKVVFIPQLDLSTRSNNKITKEMLSIIRKKHPEIYYLSLDGVFAGNESSPLGIDSSHFTEYGSRVVAEEIFLQLSRKGLLNIRREP